MRRLAGSLLCVVALGCAGRTTGDEDAGIAMVADDGVPPQDAGSPPDAGVSPSDAGRDAGGPTGCACPTLPVTCLPPPPLTPAFTPEATAVASQLFGVIACAESTLQVAIYEAQWDCIRGALQAALDRDSDLRLDVIVDDRECPLGGCFVDELTPTERVTVRRDARSGLMHHKFVIADGTYLWVGSTNFTARSFCSDHNNSLAIDDPIIVERYGAVFDRMFTLEDFGPVAPEGGTTSGPYTVYFSPESPTSAVAGWMTEMVRAIGEATTSVEAMIFAWTRTEVSDALLAAAARGVTVRALVTGSYADDAPAQALLGAGIDVRVGSVHSKVLILDGETVVTGSANWSENAWSNNENSLWIADAEVAAAFEAQFESVFTGATPAMLAP